MIDVRRHTAFSSIPLFMALSLVFMFGANAVSAQNMSLNATGAQPDPSAMLDVQSTSQGLLIPRMTEAQRAAIASPADGLMIYQTDGASGLYLFDGAVTDWVHSLDSADVAALITAAGDDLGNHSMTQDFSTNGFSISNDGDIEGISIDLDGRVSVTGATAGNTNLFVNGMVRTTGQGSGLEISNNQISITGNNGNTGDIRLRTGSTDRIRITSPGFVGIGTNSPTSQLEVAGDVEIPAANDYTYSTAKTNYVSVSASAFTPIDRLTFDGTGTGNARWISGGTAGNANVMYAPINLPDGASITEFEIFYNDQDAVYAVSGEIEGFTLSTNSIFSIATTPTSTAGIGSVTDNTISHIVNNASITYFLKFNTYEANSDLWIRGAVITYTVTKAD